MAHSSAVCVLCELSATAHLVLLCTIYELWPQLVTVSTVSFPCRLWSQLVTISTVCVLCELWLQLVTISTVSDVSYVSVFVH